MNIISKTIIQYRKKLGLTQEALANLVGVSTQTVSKWETATNMPDISLLPILSDAFGITLDELFGRTHAVDGCHPTDVLDQSCNALLKTIHRACYEGDHLSFDTALHEYIDALKDNDTVRTAVIRQNGIVYYREELGGLLLRKPKDGWSGLLDTDITEVFTLLENIDFRKALAFISHSRTTSFTMASLCNKVTLENREQLEGLLNTCGLFSVKTVDIGTEELQVFDIAMNQKSALLFAILCLCREYNSYKEIYYNFHGDYGFYME